MADKLSTAYGWGTGDPTEAHAYTLPAILRLLPEGRLRILDVGCGNGFTAGKLAEMGHDVTGVDASPDGIAIARARYPGVRWEVRSAYEDLTDLATGGADAVIACEVIEHLFRPRLFLARLFQALRPGGTVILTTPYHGYWKNLAISLAGGWDRHFAVTWEGGHIKFFSERTLSKMMREAGFAGIAFRNAGRFPYLWKSMVVRGGKPA